jgi:zinc-ribbon domain
MFCPKCGKEMTEESAFCAGCGANIGTEAKSASRDINNLNILAIIGGALFVVSFILPWIDLWLLSIPGYKLAKIVYENSSGPIKYIALTTWLLPISGLGIIYYAYTKNENTDSTIKITLLGSVALLCYLIYDIKNEVGSYGNAFRTMDIGLYALIAGIAVFAICVYKKEFEVPAQQ